MHKVSIIIPCFNAEKWVEKSISSACEQTYENIEVIFCDNDSTDNSLNIARHLKETKYPSLVIETAPNVYKYSWEEPVNKSLSVSTGDYFTMLGADDYLDPDYVKNFMKFISIAPDKIMLIQSTLRGVDKDEKFVGDLTHAYRNIDEFKQLLFQKCPVNTPTVVYNKKLYYDGLINWESEKWLGANDYNLYFSLTDNKQFIYPVNKWLGYYYRWHKEQSTWGMHQEEKKFDIEIKKYWREKWKI
jgi:glycosyltransferase involved in cell wall biosynthesis